MDSLFAKNCMRRRSDEKKPSTGLSYRHSGDVAVGDVAGKGACIFRRGLSVDYVSAELGSEHITHLHVKETTLPSLKVVAPKVTVLKIENTAYSLELTNLKDLTSLRELYILRVQFKYGLHHVIAPLTFLEKLEVSFCQLTDLPKSISKLTSLKDLSLYDNNFCKGLPEVIGELPSLENLNIGLCHLTTLPSSLRLLTKLKSLNLTYNRFFAGTPEVVSQLLSLEDLDLSFCSLKELPSLSSLESLKKLNFNGNNAVSALPENIGSLSYLEQLILADCNIRKLPSSINSMKKLKLLNLQGNNFSNGLPQAVGLLSALEELNLKSCGLTKLSDNLPDLQLIKTLNLDCNKFETLPQEICLLRNLQTLSMRSNWQLQTLNEDILQLTRLRVLWIDNCTSLSVPPQNVTKQGLSAIKQYYKDLKKGVGGNLPAATISVIGKTRSGKTSLIKSLQCNRRVLTGDSATAVDVSTKVFNFEKVEVDKTILRFIDFGGQEVYHMAYGLTLRANCVPVIVVSMEMYRDMSKEIGDREALRRLFFDWMAHLFLAEPNLSAPKLVLTHKDKFSPKEFEELKSRFINHSDGVRDAILSEETRLNRTHFHEITHLAKSRQVFEDDEIFELGKDYDSDQFTRLKGQLLERCQQFAIKVPKIWERVESHIQSLSSSYLLLAELTVQLKEALEIDKEQLKIILTYMHFSGKLLWYKDHKSLRNYVFHKTSVVIELLNVLYDHNPDARWNLRLNNFREYQIQSEDFYMEKYEDSVERFKEKGIISWMLLAYLVRSESQFNTDDQLNVALALFNAFRLVFGPVTCDNELSYIVPHFAVGYLPALPATTLDMQLQVDLVFKGLALPQYVYHEMTVGALKMFKDEQDYPVVLHNGAMIEVNDSVISLTHDAKAGRTTVLVSSNTDDINESWSKLIAVVNSTIQHVMHSWKAARFECILYCAHCKLIGNPQPRKVISPSWCILSNNSLESFDSKMKTIKCGKEKVFSVFKFPCGPLCDADKIELKKFVAASRKQKQFYAQTQHRPPDAKRRCIDPNTNYEETTFFDAAKQLEDTNFQLTPTPDHVIKTLFNDTDQVYQMTSPRGLALVINNHKFDDAHKLPDREGSDVDVRNVTKMLKSFHFDVRLRSNLSTEEMLAAVVSTVTEHEDIGDYGMFTLVLMSHGGSKDTIFGREGNVIDLHDVYYLLSSHHFKAMARKPKMVIVQACGGVMGDIGKDGLMKTIDERPVGMVVRPHITDTIDHLNTDDLIMIKACFDNYASLRHDELGSPFICCLVYTFYKHACDKDVKALFEMIQHGVRTWTIQLTNQYPHHCYGQSPVYLSMLTNYRKLHLFPGYK